ncbi:MAG: sodium/glutamate symporter [Xanthomonadaceae bacterium]|nr:sodium/glutamate symporter [Xanthomonadaceae bacterium]
MGHTSLNIDALHSVTLAILLLFVGKRITQRSGWLRRNSMPEAVIGGVLCAAVVGVAYFVFDIRIVFDLELRNLLLLYFFAAIGLNSKISDLLQGGRPLLMLALLAVAFIVLQNLLGMAVAAGFGLDRRAGLMAGSVALVGGAGTTLAWAPIFVERWGINNALELGLSSNMVGVVAACIIGGPIAGVLMRRNPQLASNNPVLDIGLPHEREQVARLDYEGVLRALFWLNNALLLGQGIGALLRSTGLNLPDFVSCMLAGIVLRNVMPRLLRNIGGWNWPSMHSGLSMISDICLGLFLTMALMGVQLWELQSVLAFVLVSMMLQILLAVLYARYLVFRIMGGDYEAVVIAAGFGGIALGSATTAVANMTAVTQQYGAARRAFIIVPLVTGFFVGLINALIIDWMS